MSSLYDTKAEKYAKYRWDYAAQAIAALFDTADVSLQTVVADLGAGTGILTRHFVGKTKLVYALEPEDEMRGVLERVFSGNRFCQIINGSAEHSGLAAHSVDLISVGQAIHWFEPEAARKEFLRILKPAGWLALLRNYGTDPVYEKAVGQLFEKFSKPEPAARISRQPLSFYFGNDSYQKLLFPFEYTLDWEYFLGSLMSSAFMPDENSPNYAEFESRAREVFDILSLNGQLKSTGETELLISQVTF
ncbi:MAG TPA: hypothetical protein DCG54_01870 [Anaerolineae bacterium]|nr:hypothetical protein [Anaerolineae bacterium]